MKKAYHVTPGTEGRWVIRRSGSDRAQKAFDTQKDAIEYAKDRVRRIGETEDVDLYIHQRDGRISQRISQRDSYGPDPKASKKKR